MQKKFIFGAIVFALLFVPIYPESRKSAAGKKADAPIVSTSTTNSGMSLGDKLRLLAKFTKYGLKYGPKYGSLYLLLGFSLGSAATHTYMSAVHCKQEEIVDVKDNEKQSRITKGIKYFKTKITNGTRIV